MLTVKGQRKGGTDVGGKVNIWHACLKRVAGPLSPVNAVYLDCCLSLVGASLVKSRAWLLPCSAAVVLEIYTWHKYGLQRQHIYPSVASEETMVVFGSEVSSNYWCFPRKNCKNFCFHLQQTPTNFWDNKSTDHCASVRRPPRSSSPLCSSSPQTKSHFINSFPSR